MPNQAQKLLILENLAALVELPESAYKKAVARYEDIGNWFRRPESKCLQYDPHIFPQGSFRLGTAIYPLNMEESYDLDLACKLRQGISKLSHTQRELKKIVGDEVESYRLARKIQAPKEEKRRCWRLEYQDELSFHLDIVPCIPEDDAKRKTIFEAIRSSRMDEALATAASNTTVSITDFRNDSYESIGTEWNISNPEGYGFWFINRMNLGRLDSIVEAQVDDVPLYKRKTPLQRSIQLLKRHRDRMFRDDPEVKPASIIITTLSAQAYQGGVDIESALRSILDNMERLISPSRPRVPNPVDPGEDFADRWQMPEHKDHNLEQNFRNWIRQARIDFGSLTEADSTGIIVEQMDRKFSVHGDAAKLSQDLGLPASAVTMGSPRVHKITEPAKPWRDESR